MSCECPNPSPSIDCNPVYDSNITSGPMVKMYLGQRVDTTTGELTIYSATTEDFKIAYSLQELIDAGVLPSSTTPTFYLTERELLFTASYESWTTYVASMITCDEITFGSTVYEALGIDMIKWKEWCVKMLSSVLDNILVGNLSVFARWVLSEYVVGTLSNEEKNLIESKLILCYQWLKKIHDEYYGKAYLVKIGEVLPTSNTTPFNGVCIKDRSGNVPTRTRPFIVEGDGSAQGLYVSDEIVSDGGMPPDYGLQPIPILGLDLSKDSDIFRTDDGRLDCFVRFASLRKNSDPNSATIDDDIIITKFNRQYTVDISKLSPENYTISTRLYQPVPETISHTQNLFIKAKADTKIYVDTDGQWALVTLSQLVPLVPINSRGNYRWATDFMLALTTNNLKDFWSRAIDAVGSAAEVVANGGKKGALNNSSQLNIIIPNDLTVFPEAFAIPMKSNILRYGPYFASTDSSGGVDIVTEDFLAPWNFLDIPASGGMYQYNIKPAYDAMGTVGQALADESVKNNLDIENGKITVAGLPQYNLAFQPAYSAPGPLGPQALLSDVSVSYGTGGFTTTYNFATFTPRFGQPAKYLIDRWSDSIKETQSINRYLREERQKVRNISNTLQQTFSSKQISSGFTDRQLIEGPKGKTSASPNRFLYSGYFLTQGVPPSIPPDNPEPLFDISLPMPCCDPCASDMPISAPPYNEPPPPGTGVTEYVFAETHTGYSDEYIQDTYHQLAIMSLDGHFLPVSLKGTPKQPEPDPSSSVSIGFNCQNFEWTVLLPRFAMRQEDDGSFIDFDNMSFGSNGAPGSPVYNKSRHSMPPFIFGTGESNNVNTQPITQQYLNPILSSALMGYWDDRKNDSSSGFAICSIAFGCKFTDFELTFGMSESERQDHTNFRFSALRGPLVLQGWGYDTNGKPIPNAYDDPLKAMEGKFKRTGLSDKFMPEWISAPKTWPVGPIDLRFDRERGVWTMPPQNKIIVARLKEPLLPFGSARAELVDPDADGLRFYEQFDISGPLGQNIKDSLDKATIKVYDFIGMSLCECDIIYAYFDDNRYIVLESSRTYTNNKECVSCSPGPCPSPSLPPTPSVSVMVLTPTVRVPTPPPSASPCWCNLECLKTLSNYDPCKRQALVHYDGCLTWEDIVQCDPVQNAIEQEKYPDCQANHPPPWTELNSSY